MDLNELGIDIDEMKEEIKILATEKLLRLIKCKLINDITKIANDLINEKINNLIEETLNELYYPIDEYGDSKGEKTTLRELFKKNALEWWNQYVDSEGKFTISTYGNTKKRYEYIASNTIKKLFDNEIKNDLNRIFKNAKEELKEGLSKAIAEKIANF